MVLRLRYYSTGYVALLIAMALLGHDVLMAADAHARPDAAVETRHAGHSHDAMAEANPGAGQHIANASAPDHESRIDACSTMRHLVQRPGTPVHLNAELGTVAATVRVEPPLPVVDHWWREPTAPPNVVRALFQVFLI